MLFAVNDIIGYTIAASDKAAGKLNDIYIDDAQWTVRHFVVDDPGGVGIQPALIEPHEVTAIDRKHKRVKVARTQEDIAGGPDITTDPPVSHRISVMDDPRLRSAEELCGYGVEATDGAAGRLEDMIVDDDGWTVEFVVVATQDGEGASVLVAPGLVERVDFDAKTVHVELNRTALANSPAYDPAHPPKDAEKVATAGSRSV